MRRFVSETKAGAVVADVNYEAFREEGEIILHDPLKKYVISHATGSGRWTVRPESESSEPVAPVIEAHKPKWYKKDMILNMGDASFEMAKTSTFRRNFVVKRLEKQVAVDAEEQAAGEKNEAEGGMGEGNGAKIALTKTGLLKTSYSISFDNDVPLELAVFCYWMANLFLRRDAEDTSNNIGAGSYA